MLRFQWLLRQWLFQIGSGKMNNIKYIHQVTGQRVVVRISQGGERYGSNYTRSTYPNKADADRQMLQRGYTRLSSFKGLITVNPIVRAVQAALYH